MRLLWTKTIEVKGKDYGKWHVTIPPDQIESLGWDRNDELVSEVLEGKLVVRRVAKAKSLGR